MVSLVNKSTGKVYTSSLGKNENAGSKVTLTNKETGQVYEPSYTGVSTTKKVTTLPTVETDPIKSAASALKTALPMADTNAKTLFNLSNVMTGGTLPVVAGTAQNGEKYAQAAQAAAQKKTAQQEARKANISDDFSGDRTYAGGGRENNQFSVGKLLGGVAAKGADEFVSGLTSTAAWLENMTLGKLFPGTTDNSIIQAINDRVQQAKEHNKKYTAPNVAAGGKAAEIIDKYGTSVMAAIPQAGLALYTGGASTAAQGTTAGLQAASTAAQASGGLMSTVKSAVTALSKDPQYWLSFAQVAGNSYDQAKADGADDTRASLYALGNGLMNAAVEVGGGIETLPAELQGGKGAFKTWVNSMLDEGKEEVVQGVLERGLQNLIYGKDNPLIGIEDENAILNPKTAGEEFLGGAVVGGILGGAQTGINAALNAGAKSALPVVEQTTEPTTLPMVEQVGTDTSAQNSAVEGVQGQNNTASTGETGDYYFDASDTNDSWRDRMYTENGVTYIQSQDKQRMYVVPKQSEIQHEVRDDGTVVLKDDVVSNLSHKDYRDFAKAYSALNLVSNFSDDRMNIANAKPVIVKSTGNDVVVTQTGINDFAKKLRGKGIKNRDNVSSVLLLDKLIENSTPVASSGNNHTSTGNPFTYYKGKLEVGGRTYDVTLHIKNVPGRDQYYYHALDKVDIRPEAQKNVAPVYGSPANSATYQTETETTFTDPSIFDNSSGVNRNSAQNSDNVSMSAEGSHTLTMGVDPNAKFMPGSELDNAQRGTQRAITELPNVKGVNSNGAEQTGRAVSDGGRGRISDQRTGGQAGQQGAGAQGARRSTAFQGRTAVERQNRANGLWGDKVSSRSLGLTRGTDDAVLTVMPESIWDAEMRSTAQKVKSATGRKVTYVVGGIQITAEDGSARLVRGVYSGKSIVIQADNRLVSVEQIADHEIFHDMARQSPGLVNRIRERIVQRYSAEEFRKVVEIYIEKLRGVIDVEDSSTQFVMDDALADIYEEICADAYAGINAFAAHAERYRGTAQETVRETGLTGKTRQSAAAVERTTGPPERYSIGRTTENVPFVEVEQDILDGVPEADWVSEVKRNLKQKFPCGVTVGNNQIEINYQSRGEMTFSRYMQWLYQNDPQLRKDKLRATNNADEILVAATDWVNEGLNHPRKDSIRDFARGSVLLRVGGNDYSADVVVGTQKNGKMLLYDILDLQRTSFAKKETDTAIAENPSPGANRSTASISGDTVSHFTLPVKEKFSVEELPRAEMLMVDEDVQELSGKVRQKDGTWQFPDGSTDIDTYTENLTRRAEQEKAERMRNKSRAEFKGSAALDKLGVKIDNSVGSYEHLQQLINNDRAAKLVVKELKRAEQRLNATEAERNFASGIAAGIYSEADVPASMDASKVTELADYYWAAEATGQNLIRQQRADIGQSLSEKMGEIMKGVDADAVKLPKGFTLNHRTPTRNMITIFGDEVGGKLNDFLFKPSDANEAERLRFVNRMYDEVRTFEDSKGRQRALTKTERAVVQQVMEGKAAAEIVSASSKAETIRSAAESIRESGDVNGAVQEFHLTREERKLARQYAMWLETQDTLNSGKVDTVKVENAAKKYSEMFDRFYEATNEFLVAHGYEPIGFIKGYAPHIQTNETQNLLNKAFKSMGLSADVSALPASIAGETANFKPNKRWNPFHQHRMGENTQYDIAAGYETYVDYMSDILYHTDDIMRVRQASEYFRRRYSPENIRESLEQAEELRYASTERKANYLRDNGVVSRTTVLSDEDVNRLMDEYVDKQYEDIRNTTKFSDLVMWLDDYANKQAGKQLFADRSMERTVGRVSLNVGRKLTQTFARAKVAGNLSSALNQGSQLTMILGENGARYTAAAVKDSFTGKLRKNNWAQESDFLTEKKGISYIVNSPAEMVTTALFKPLEFTDSLMATMAVRGRYLKEINAGKSHAEAMKAADEYGRKVMGSRSKSSAPLAFQQKDLVSQMLHVFQLEAANSWDHLRVDMQQDFRQIQAEKGKAAAVGALAGVIVKMLLSAFVLNRIDEELYGGTPAQFDLLGLFTNFVASGEGLTTNEYLRTVIDNGWEKLTGERLFDTEELDPEEFDWGSALEDTAYNVGNDIPYLSNAMGLLGLGDETLPMPDLYGAGENVVSAVRNHGLISGETGKAALGAAAELLPGGNQLNKTAQGVEALIRGGDYSGYGEDARLKYPLDDSVGTAVKSVLFGKTKTDAAGEYYASGASPLSAEQTRVYQSLVEQGADRQEVYGAVQDFRELDNDKELTAYERGVQQRDLIRGMDLTDEQKLELYQGLTGADSRAEKFRTLMDAGMAWDAVMDAFDKYCELNEEDTTASAKAQTFAKWVGLQGYTAKQTQAVKEQLAFYSVVAAGAERYESLTDTLTGAGMSRQTALSVAEEYINATKVLTADKDENGKAIAGSKKEKIVAVIDGMSLTSEQKDALYLAEGYAESTLKDTLWHKGDKYTLPSRDWSQVTELPRVTG